MDERLARNQGSTDPAQAPGTAGKNPPIEPSALLIEEATFRGETSSIRLEPPVWLAALEAEFGLDLSTSGTIPEPPPTKEPRVLLGLHATDPPLGSGRPDKRDSLIGISPPLPTGSNSAIGGGGDSAVGGDSTVGGDSAFARGGSVFVGGDSAFGIPIPIWYRNPFPIDGDPPSPTWTQIRPYPDSAPEGSLPGDDGSDVGTSSERPFLFRLAHATSLDIAVTLWYGPPATPGGKRGAIRLAPDPGEEQGDVVGDTGSVGPEGETPFSPEGHGVGPDQSPVTEVEPTQGGQSLPDSSERIPDKNARCVLICYPIFYDLSDLDVRGEIEDALEENVDGVDGSDLSNEQARRAERGIGSGTLGKTLPFLFGDKLVLIKFVPCLFRRPDARHADTSDVDPKLEDPPSSLGKREDYKRIKQHERGHARHLYLAWLLACCLDDMNPDGYQSNGNSGWINMNDRTNQIYHDIAGRKGDLPEASEECWTKAAILAVYRWIRNNLPENNGCRQAFENWIGDLNQLGRDVQNCF